MKETRFTRWLRRLAEKVGGTFYEGPEAPERLQDVVHAFAEAHPRATRAEWASMAVELAREAYRVGYARGYENSERDPDEPAHSPEEVASAVDPDWRWRRIELVGGEMVVHEEEPDGREPRRDGRGW
jgi:hypothetical protein